MYLGHLLEGHISHQTLSGLLSGIRDGINTAVYHHRPRLYPRALHKLWLADANHQNVCCFGLKKKLIDHFIFKDFSKG